MHFALCSCTLGLVILARKSGLPSPEAELSQAFIAQLISLLPHTVSTSQGRLWMYEFPGTIITKPHKLGGLNNRKYCLTALEPRCPRSRCWQCGFLLRAVRQDLFQTPSSLLVASGILWLLDGTLPVFSHCLPSTCLFLCPIFPFIRITILLD